MANENSPLSYQTTYPEYPDVSYEGYRSAYGAQSGLPRWAFWLEQSFAGNPDYNTWRQSQLDEYNAKVNEYNTWLSTGEGIAASAASGGYNKSYFDGGSASASPLNYASGVSPEPNFQNISSALGGVFNFIQALQSMRMVTEQIQGQKLKNQQQEIQNNYLSDFLYHRNRGTQFKGDLLGYQSDAKNLQNSAELYAIYKDNPDLWMTGAFAPFGTMTYDLRGQDKSLSYQNAITNLEYVQAGKKLRDISYEIQHYNKQERAFYVESIQSIYKDLLDYEVKIKKGEFDFQPTEQRLRKRAIQVGIGTDIANSIIGAAKTVVSFTNPGVGAALSASPSWGNMPNQSQSWGSGWDATTGSWINPYNGYQ